MLLEWTAKNPAAATYDGDAPRVLMRWQRPFVNHNGGQLGFNPLARPGSADYGLLYVGNADGGSGGDPMNLAQNLGSSSARSFASIRSAITVRTGNTASRKTTRLSTITIRHAR